MDKKRPILVQGAMDVEINYLKETIINLQEIELFGYKFYKGLYNNYPIIISKTNIGLIQAAVATFIAITNFNPVAVINQGTAGANSKDIHNHDIVIGDECININSYITSHKEETQGSNPLEWELLTFKEGKDEFLTIKSDERLCDIATKCSKQHVNGKIAVGRIGSGDMWDNEIDRIKWFNEKYNILCEDMESISSYTVCNKFNIPVIGIRVISDNELTKEQYERTSAIEAQKYTLEICKKLIEGE